jgi:hypothetical protein
MDTQIHLGKFNDAIGIIHEGPLRYDRKQKSMCEKVKYLIDKKS